MVNNKILKRLMWKCSTLSMILPQIKSDVTNLLKFHLIGLKIHLECEFILVKIQQLFF